MKDTPLHFKYAPNLNTLFNIPAPTDSHIRLSSSFSEETFIEDVLKMFYFSKDLKSYVFMGLLGGVLKLYDNIVDWDVPVTNYIHEWLKATIVVFTTIAFLFDLNAVYGVLCFQIFNFKSKIHGIDTDFFHMGMMMVCAVSFLNFLVNKITLRNFIELGAFALMGYCESLLFSEEVSDSKFLVRFFVVIGGIVITLLDLTGILKVFSKNIIQIMVLGIFYILMDLAMITGTYFYDSDYLKQIMKKDKSKRNIKDNVENMKSGYNASSCSDSDSDSNSCIGSYGNSCLSKSIVSSDTDSNTDNENINQDVSEQQSSNTKTESLFSPTFKPLSNEEKLKQKRKHKQTEIKRLKRKKKQKLEKKKQRNKKEVDVRSLRDKENE